MQFCTKKSLVEETSHIGIEFLKQFSNQRGAEIKGHLSLPHVIEGSFCLFFSPDCDWASIELDYVYTNTALNETKQHNIGILMAPQLCHFGSQRWWFICPHLNGNRQCKHKVKNLYFGQDGSLGCRVCQNLTYKSAQTHNPRISYLLGHPQALDWAFNNSRNWRWKVTALDALEKLEAKARKGKVSGTWLNWAFRCNRS